MKRLTVVVLTSIMCFSLAACGVAPEGMSKGAYEEGKTALSAADDYLDEIITASDALDIINSSGKKLDEWGKTGNDIENFLLSCNVSSLEWEIHTCSNGKSTIDNVVEARNKVAKSLGKMARKAP